jgi:Cu/Ag efflux protein CusF
MIRCLVPLLSALWLAPPAWADQHQTLTQGEVRKVDKGARKITIQHEPIRNLEMPAMTMAFAVKDAAMLDAVKRGDKVRFRVEKIGEAYTVTLIQKAN